MKLKIFNLNFKIPSSIPSSIGYELANNKVASAPYKEVTKLLFKSKLKDDILEYNPDILISSHFFASILMGLINKKHDTNTKIITILTDYASHSYWIRNHKNEDAFIVSNEIVKRELIKFGVLESKIYPFGIPLSNKFKNIEENTYKIKLKYNINNKKPVFLFFGGGSQGSSFSYNYFKQLVKHRYNINIIFVSGKNVKLQNKCNELIKSENIKNVTVLGFTKDVSNLLNIADCVITKPGGLSVTEALEMKTPMILIPGNGGQENYNARFITKNNFGIRIRFPSQLGKAVKKLIDDKELINNMKNNLYKYDENKSVEKLFNLVEEMVK